MENTESQKLSVNSILYQIKVRRSTNSMQCNCQLQCWFDDVTQNRINNKNELDSCPALPGAKVIKIN